MIRFPVRHKAYTISSIVLANQINNFPLLENIFKRSEYAVIGIIYVRRFGAYSINLQDLEILPLFQGLNILAFNIKPAKINSLQLMTDIIEGIFQALIYQMVAIEKSSPATMISYGNKFNFFILFGHVVHQVPVA